MPEFTSKFRDAEVAEGRTATFECEIHGTPAPEIRFYKGNREIFDGGKYKIVQDGDKYTLTIQNVTLDDEEEYCVKAKNKGGSRLSRANLTIMCKFDTELMNIPNQMHCS